MSPARAILTLSDSERRFLTRWARQESLSNSRAIPRAQIVLALAEGASNTQVARQLSIHTDTVSRWKQRFTEEGISGLKDKPRPGAPRKASAEIADRVVRAAERGGGRSTRSLAEEFGLTQSTVSRILRSANALNDRPTSDGDAAEKVALRTREGRVPKPRRGRRGSRDVRELLLEAAERVTAREGRAATLKAIAREAGVARSVLYQHFSSRQQLLTEAAITPFTEFLESFREISLAQLKDRRRPVWEMENEYISGILEHFSTHKHFFETVLSERTALSESISSALRRTLHDVIDELVEVGISEVKAHRPDIPIETVGVKVRLTTALVIGVITSQHWLLPQGSTAWSTDELIRNLAAFSLYGVQNGPMSVRLEHS